MALDPAYFFYSDGTITLTNGSDIVTGTFTSWETAVLPFDILYPNDGQSGVSVVKQVNSQTEIQLAKPWTGPTLENVPYFILRWVKHTDPKVYGIRISEYLTKVKAIPENIEEVAGQINADRQAVDAALLALQQLQQEVGADRQAVDTAAGQIEQARQEVSGKVTLASSWAEAPEDTDVDGPGTRSARHYAAKAQQALDDVLEGIVPDKAVTNTKMADMPAGTVKANLTELPASPSDVPLADLKTALGVGENIPLLPQDGSPFGLANFRLLLGEREDAHYGFNNAILDAGNGKWIFVYRKASNHTVVNGSEIRAFDSYDKGATRVNDRLIFSNAAYDTRNFVCRVMANGRLGILASRREAEPSLTYLAGIFIYSDDGGVTWSTADLPIASPGYPVNFHGQMLDYPASVGGNDTTGFIAYSYGSDGNGNIDALYTTNNGTSWTWQQNVAQKVAPVVALLEPCVARVGTQNKWLMYARVSGQDNAVVFTSTDLLNWSVQADSGLHLEGNPPQTLYDPATNKIWFMAFARKDRGIYSTSSSVGLESYLVIAGADADALWSANGNFSTLGIGWSHFSAIPNWASGYIFPSRIDGRWYATFVAGEDYENHNYSKLFLIGDFLTTGADMLSVARQLVRNAEMDRAFAQRLQVGYGVTPPTQPGFITANVSSSIPGVVTEVFSASPRQAAVFRNPNGAVGNITTSGTTTAYNTSSDYRLKENEEPLPDALIRLGQLKPYRFNFKADPTTRVDGFFAHEVQEIVPEAVFGEKDAVDEKGVPAYQAIDHSKLVPLLVAAVQELSRKVEELEARAAS